jgi:hypothetical protein
MRKAFLLLSILIISCLIWFCDREDKSKSEQTSARQDTQYSITKGEYSHYVGDGSLKHISDSLVIVKGYTTLEDIAKTTCLYDYYEHDTLRLRAKNDLLEAAIIFEETEKRDTIDFKIEDRELGGYYVKLSNHNIDYEKLERIKILYREEGNDRCEFVLSKNEFAGHYKHLVKYLKLKKIKKGKD